MKIDKHNYEEFLISKLEGLLSRKENAEVDLFLQQNPELQMEWEAFQQTISVPSEEIVFPNKESLKRKAKPVRKVVPLYRNLTVAASIAAAVFFAIYLGVFKFDNTVTNPVASTNEIVPEEIVTPTVKEIAPVKNEQHFIAENHSTSKTNQSNKKKMIVVPASNGDGNQIENENLQEQSVTKEEQSRAVATSMNSEEENSGQPVVQTSFPQFVWSMPVRTERHEERNNNAAEFAKIASAVGTDLIRMSGRGDMLNSLADNNPVNAVRASMSADRFPLYKKLVSGNFKTSNPK